MEYIRENRHMKTSLLLVSLAREMRWHSNYFGVIGNLAGLHCESEHNRESLVRGNFMRGYVRGVWSTSVPTVTV
jgi:hypothetical protein